MSLRALLWRDIFWPRFVAVLVLAALVFFSKPSHGLIEAEAEQRAQKFTALLMEAVLPATTPHDDKRGAGRRNKLTGAPTGARLLQRNKPAAPRKRKTPD
jgi:hypothetical protein